MWFRGFIRTENKKALERFKNKSDLKQYNDVKDLPEFAGILAQDTVLIDVDDKEQSEILLKIIENENVICQVRETTRGKHFFFKNNGAECFTKCHTQVKLACGITADIKVGVTNSYSILKIRNKERPIIYDKFDNEEYEVVPTYLNVVNSNIDFLNLDEGRNTSLFNYIVHLQTAGFTKDEIIATENIINKYVFTKPLSQSEMDTILRDEAFVTAVIPSFFKEKQFLFDEFAKYLVNNLPIKRINGLLHVYQDGYYQDGIERIEREMIKLIPNLSQSRRTEVYKYINILTVDDDNLPAPANYIGFKNGIYNLETDTLSEFTPDVLLTNKIPYNYNVEAKSDLLEHTLNRLSCDDVSIRCSLEEMVGYTMYRRNEMRKAFILTGDKKNGKSTFLAVIQKMLGDDNVAALDMKELSERFKTAELYRKLANIGDDIADDFIGDTAQFKKLVSGDRVSAERKGEHPFSFNNYSKLIFSANNLPRVKDKTGAVLDRLIIIPFNATFDKSDPDYRPFIKSELQEDDSIEYLIKLGIDALKRVLERKEFTIGKEIEIQLDDYNEINNPIITFYEDWPLDKVKREPIDFIYSSYKEFCLVNNYTPISRIEFSRQVNKHYNLTIEKRRINGKIVKYFISKNVN